MRRPGSTAGKRGRARMRPAALCALAALAVLALPAGAQQGAGQTMQVSWSGLGAERIKTVPIAKRKGAKTRVAMSLPPDKVGPVTSGDSVYANGEVEVSVTCLEPMPKCVGRIYHFSPYVRARLVLAPGPDAASPGNTTPISDWKRIQCAQDLPHRNHHCVIALAGTRDIAGGDGLPCTHCNVNLLVDAYHRSARRGNVIVIGSDSDDGIQQDKGTVNAAVWEPGPRPNVAPTVTRRRSIRKVPVGTQGGAGMQDKVVLSRRLNALQAGEQLLVDARIRIKTGHLPYGTLLQSRLVLSEKAWSVSRSGTPGKIASQKGAITAQNGFNCTRGRSAHTSPCLVRKVGVVKIFKDARTRPELGEGPAVPLFVNLVVQSKAEFGGERHRSGDAARVARRGRLAVTRFGPEYRR